jgi:hypothetical protein
MTQGTLNNTMRTYPVEFFRQAQATTANRVNMTPCKYNAGVITMSARTDYLQNGAFRNSSYWTASGGSFWITQGKRGVSGYYSARFLVSGTQGLLTSDVISLGSAFSTSASVYVTSNVATTVSIRILGTDSGGTTTLDTTSSADISLDANITKRINVSSTFAGSNFRKLVLVVGDGTATQNGVEVYWSQAELINSTRTALDFNDEGSTTTTYGYTAGQLTYNLTLGHGSSIELPVPISGSFWTRVGSGGQTGAPNTTLFAMTGVSTASLNYAKSTSTLSFAVSGGTINVTSLNLVPGDYLWVGFTISKTNIKLFYSLNGAAVVTTAAGSNAAPGGSFSTLHVGHDATPSNHWEGSIEQFLLYEVALSDAEQIALAAKTTPTNMKDDSRIQFAAVTDDQENQFWNFYIKATNLSGRWNGSWRNPDIRARITNNKTNTGKAFNLAEFGNIQRETNWDLSGGSSSWKQYRVWNSALIGKSDEWYYSNFYCLEPEYPDQSLFEAWQVLDIPGQAPVILVTRRFGFGGKDRSGQYMPTLTYLRPYPEEQRTFGYVS